MGDTATTPSGGTAAQAPPTAQADTDSIVAELLGSHKSQGNDSAQEPEADADGEADHAEESDTDAAVESDDAESPETEEVEATELGADGETLSEARAALESGDLDKAFELAFGKKPEEVQPGNKAWTQWRAANKRATEAIAAKETKLRSDTTQAQQWFASERAKIENTLRELQPYEAHREAALAFQRDGDPQHLVKLVELTSGMTYDEAQKIVLTKQRRSPAERALQQKLAELERKLQERESTQTQAQQQAEQQRVYQSDLAIIERDAVGALPEVGKVPQFKERIYRLMLKSKGPTGLTLTVAQAAKQVLAGERRRLAAHPLLAKPKVAPKSPVSAAASTLAKSKARKAAATTGAPLRRDSQPTGVRPAGAESTDDIINDLLRGKAKRA